MSLHKTQIKVNDKVKVIAGRDKGKIGKVLRLVRKHNRILVENINVVKKHTRPNAQNRQGGIIENEAPLDASNVLLMCNKCVTPSRIRMKRLEDGKKVRVCGKCGEQIDA